MTREHLFPKALDELICAPYKETQYFSERIPSKFVESELKVRDVCANCNNNILGQLDAYATQWAREHATRHFSHEESGFISFEYDKLLRWLLKFTFNFARVHSDFSGDADLLRRFRGYILGQAKRPPRIRLSAGLVYSYVPTAEEAKFRGSSEAIHPDAIRSSLVITKIKSQYKFTVRRVSIGAFSFLILVFEPAAPASAVTKLGAFLDKQLVGFRVLQPQNTRLELKASGENTLEAWRDHIQLQGKPYNKLYEEFRRRRNRA